MKYKHCSPHNGKFTWQLTILGHPCRTSAHFDTAEEAALSVDLVKHYLRSEFKLDLPASLDGEQFSCLAFSRRNVVLSDYLSVLKSFPEDVKDFIFQHRSALEAHKAAAPPESTAAKFRRSEMIKLPAVREWVERLELAEGEAEAFAAIDSASFFLRLSVVEKTTTTAIKSLRLALKMHDGATNTRLVCRRGLLALLIQHLELNLQYVVELTSALRAEQASVETAVAMLELRRPELT